jgi:hypothetical protein
MFRTEGYLEFDVLTAVFMKCCVFWDQVKKDEMGGACNTNGEKRNTYRILVGKPEGKRPL